MVLVFDMVFSLLTRGDSVSFNRGIPLLFPQARFSAVNFQAAYGRNTSHTSQ
jgi:hypothetical protein